MTCTPQRLQATGATRDWRTLCVIYWLKIRTLTVVGGIVQFLTWIFPARQ